MYIYDYFCYQIGVCAIIYCKLHTQYSVLRPICFSYLNIIKTDTFFALRNFFLKIEIPEKTPYKQHGCLLNRCFKAATLLKRESSFICLKFIYFCIPEFFCGSPFICESKPRLFTSEVSSSFLRKRPLRYELKSIF